MLLGPLNLLPPQSSILNPQFYLLMYNVFAKHYSRVFPLNSALTGLVKEELKPGGGLLDLGCGTGELDNVLLAEGYECLGIDTDEAMTRYAGKKGHPDRFKIMRIQDIGSIQTSFDLVISTGNVMSHLAPDALANSIKDIAGLLGPGGKWIYQIVNWNRYFQQGYEFPVLEREEGRLKFYREYNGTDEQVAFSIRLEEEGRIIHQGTSILYPLAIEKHKQINESAGFTCRARYRNWNRESFEVETDDSVILVFEKK
ncbi:methyltransferase domain-containing protein [Fibrobacterota bacterium]